QEMQLPSVEAVNDVRVTRFLGRISDTMAQDSSSGGELGFYRELIERYEREHNVPAIEIAAALAKLVQGDTPLLLAPERAREPQAAFAEGREYAQRAQRNGARDERAGRPERTERPARSDRAERPERTERPERNERSERPGADTRAPRPKKDMPARSAPEPGMETYRIEVGHSHGVKPGNIVGAIANEADLDSKYIGRIDIHDEHSILDLPEGMPRPLLMHLKKVRVAGQPLRLQKVGDDDGRAPVGGEPSFKPKNFKPRAAGARNAAPGAAKPHRKGPSSRGEGKPPRK
ncbi:MAG: DbpA RNA binding domain-containing protein, partial [Xanthomonadaceae bacterium]|nr:DbpA RNA binding domain-containing protein [Xanthomonadaceae bacterium]